MDIEIRRNDDLERTDMVQAQFTTVHITSLLPLNTYSFTIFVVSDIGRSRPSMINGSTLSLSKLLEKVPLFFSFYHICSICKPYIFEYHYSIDYSNFAILASKLFSNNESYNISFVLSSSIRNQC